MTKFLELFAPLLEKLTWSKIAMLACLIVIGLAGTALWENRQAVYETAARPDKFSGDALATLSPQSVSAVNDFLKKHPEVHFMTVLSMDFQRNMRRPVSRHFNNTKVKSIVSGYEASGTDGSTPIFLTDAVANNNQMVSLINGEFSCSKFEDGQLARLMPDLKPFVKLSCRVPIPPSWSTGTMGYIVVHLDNGPQQLEVLKLDLMALSMYIYSSDVVKSKSVRMLP